MIRTAGIIIIGDEILSGMVEDANSLFMVRELRQIGIEVRHISVIRDDVADIAREVGELSGRFDYIFTSGGIGPTHDDVTVEGVAGAFGLRPAIDKRLRNFLESRFGASLTPEQLRMAEVPEGAEAIEDASIGLPLIRFRNIYILPGVPQYLREKFLVITKLLFNGNPPLLKKVYVNDYETRIAPVLNEIVRSCKDIKIGSYPAVNNSDYRVMITFQSHDEEALRAAIARFVDGIPAERLVKVEE